MKAAKRIIAFSMLATIAAPVAPIASTASAQTRRGTIRTDDARAQNIIRRLETNSDAYRQSLDEALDRSRLNGTRTEDEINRFVKDFEVATDRLRDNANSRGNVNADLQEVFNRALDIDDFMSRNRLTPRAQRDWELVRTELNRLSRSYNVAYRRSGSPFPNNGNFPSNSGINNVDARLTGTYRLDVNRSDDPRTAADRATSVLRAGERRRVYDALITRLESPQELALERRGSTVTIASTRAPQVTIDATGRDESERYPDGRSSRVRAEIVGDRLTINANSDPRNIPSDYTVIFESLNNGQQLRVTRSVYIENVDQAVTVRSLYNRTANVAQFGIYRPDNFPTTGSTGGGTNRASNGFIVPNDTALVATLETDISTQTAREGERFTMTVRDNSQFDGATIEGYISDLSRSGRVRGRSGVTLNFERITLRNNQSYQFAGAVESIRASNGEEIRVDNEGTVRDENSQTERTVQRAAIGTAVGALIGAIAGGGKGAAIGAIVGAGAGAGSVYVQGRDDLNLTRGTELTIRASAPR